MQFSPFSRHLIPLGSKYPPQHLVLKHTQSAFLTLCQRQSFTPVQNHRQNCSLVYSNWGWVHPVACVSQIKTVTIASFATTWVHRYHSSHTNIAAHAVLQHIQIKKGPSTTKYISHKYKYKNAVGAAQFKRILTTSYGPHEWRPDTEQPVTAPKW
jgi:hypothetical protein